jgi:DedD protein
MRFEIKAGGALLFLVGLAALSGVVFALGLIAGYEMARQNQVDSSQLATSYPLPSPAAAAASPAAAALPPVVANAMPTAKPSPAPMVRASAPVIAPPPPGARTASAARAAAPPPPAEEAPDEAIPYAPGPEEQAPPEIENGTAANPPSYEEAATPPAKVAAAPQPPMSRRHPYNIQIDAVMDNSGARQMADRLRKLGYNPTIVPSNIGGQTWYRIKVGPYLTEAQARAAQERLRTQYNAAYTGH